MKIRKIVKKIANHTIGTVVGIGVAIPVTIIGIGNAFIDGTSIIMLGAMNGTKTLEKIHKDEESVKQETGE